MRLQDIQEMPTCVNKTHESCFRSYWVLKHVLKMVERGDSQLTILEIVEFLQYQPIEIESPSDENTYNTPIR